MFSIPQLRNAQVVPFDIPRMVWRYNHIRLSQFARRCVFNTHPGSGYLGRFTTTLEPRTVSMFAPAETCHGAGCDELTTHRIYEFYAMPWFTGRDIDYLELWPKGEDHAQELQKLAAAYEEEGGCGLPR